MKPHYMCVGAVLSACACARITAERSLSLMRVLAEPAASPHDIADAITCLTAACATLACAWLALSYLALAAAHAGKRSCAVAWAARWGTPHVRRSLASLSLAATAFAPIAPAAPALAADEAPEPVDTSILASSIGDISWGAPQLAFAPAPAPSASHVEEAAPPAPAEQAARPALGHENPPARDYHATISVMPGDSLWTIASRHLPAGASDADIARALPHWIASNPQVTNPHLIYPGNTLTIPQEFLS